MSDPADLTERIGQLLHKWLADHGGGMPTTWYLVVEYVDADGEQRWTYDVSPGQRMTTTLGLVEWARGVAHAEQRLALEQMRGGDE